MKQSKKLILLLPILCLLFYANLMAQTIWTLEDCILYAYENNISIKQCDRPIPYFEEPGKEHLGNR